MALDLKGAVNKTIVELRREISKKSSELTSLTKELARYQKVLDVLSGPSRGPRTKAVRTVHRKPIDWNSVLKQLPGSFAVDNVANLAKNKSRSRIHHVLGKWVKQRKVKRVEPGKYKKL